MTEHQEIPNSLLGSDPYDRTCKNLSRQPLGKTYSRHRPFTSRTRDANIDSHRHFFRDKFVPSDVQSPNQMGNPDFWTRTVDRQSNSDISFGARPACWHAQLTPRTNSFRLTFILNSSTINQHVCGQLKSIVDATKIYRLHLERRSAVPFREGNFFVPTLSEQTKRRREDSGESSSIA